MWITRNASKKNVSRQQQINEFMLALKIAITYEDITRPLSGYQCLVIHFFQGVRGVMGDPYGSNVLFLKLEYWDFQTTPILFQLVEQLFSGFATPKANDPLSNKLLEADTVWYQAILL